MLHIYKVYTVQTALTVTWSGQSTAVGSQIQFPPTKFIP